MSSSVSRVALVTGGNQGIGYHIVDQLSKADASLTVLLGARDPTKGAEAAKQLGASNVKPITIDIDDEASIRKAADEVKEKYGGIDILINNAGMAFKGDAFDESVVKRTFLTNYYGTLHATNAFLPLIRPHGKIINVSSAASVSALAKMSPENRDKFLNCSTIDELTKLMDEFRAAVAAGDYKAKGYPETAYGMSKVGVSIMTKIHAKEAKNGITVNSGCPGWCKTSMAGDKAPRSPEDGARNFSHMALLPADEMTNGEFWEDSKVSSLTRDPK